MKRMSLATAIGLALLTLAMPAARAADPIKVGMLFPQSGGAGDDGQRVTRAVQVMAGLINAQGGVLGRPLEVIVRDDESTPAVGVAKANELIGQGVSLVIEDGLASIWNPGPHGHSEVLYAYTSGAANNGSAFAGLGANVPWYNVTLGIAMLAGRFLMIVPILALAGSLARIKRLAETTGTFPTTGPLWIGLLAGVIVIVGALTYFPAYALGPIIEHYAMHLGLAFSG